MKTGFEINGRKIGPQEKVYIVAEMSANHNQDFEQAVQILKAAKEAGADAVKLQTYTPDTITLRCENEYFQIGGNSPWQGRNLYDLYHEAFMPWEWQPKLKSIANEIGLDLFSTAFDSISVDFLEDIGVPIHKISSFEIVDIPLIEKVARTGKPLIISTGMATLGEIEEAVLTASKAGAKQIALLKCTSSYPAPPQEMNLKTIPHLCDAFDLPVGLSDHTLEISVSVAAVALGACIIEKHLTLSRHNSSPDSKFSLEPQELRTLIHAVHTTEKALGKVRYGGSETEGNSRSFRRSLFVVKDMRAGEVFAEENIRSIRPGYGLSPKFLRDVLGKRALSDLKRGTPLNWKMIS
jgi:N-acetylneuraminate synthase